MHRFFTRSGLIINCPPLRLSAAILAAYSAIVTGRNLLNVKVAMVMLQEPALNQVDRDLVGFPGFAATNLAGERFSNTTNAYETSRFCWSSLSCNSASI